MERNLNELYQLVYKQYKQNVGSYICVEMSRMYRDELITLKEYKLLKSHFAQQKPTPEINPEFRIKLFRFECDEDKDNTGGWWGYFLCQNEGKAIRRKFLRKMIKITK